MSNNSSVCERVDFVRYSPEHYHISWIGMGAVVKNKAFVRFVCLLHAFIQEARRVLKEEIVAR